MTDKTTKGPLKLTRVSSEEYLENLEPPEIKISGSSFGLKSLSEKNEPERLEGFVFWTLMGLIFFVPISALLLYLFFG